MKNFNRKRIDLFLIITAILIFGILLAGRIFRPNGKTARTELYVSPQCVEIFGADTCNLLFREYENQNPYLKIRINEQRTAAEDHPASREDIVFFSGNELDDFLAAEDLASLAPYMHDETQTGASQWALPLVSFMDLFFYNIDILTAADCVRPPKTRAEFISTSQAIVKQGTNFPFAIGLRSSAGIPAAQISADEPVISRQALRREILPWVWEDSPDLYTVSAGKPALSKAAQNTVSFFGQLNREKLLAEGTFEKTAGNRLEEFTDGKIAMLTGSSRDIPFLQNSSINFGLTAVPATVNGKNRLGLTFIYAGISADCANPDGAWAFLVYIAGNSPLLARTLKAVPGLIPGTDGFPQGVPGEYITEDPLLSKAWEIYEAAEIIVFTPDDNSEADKLLREKISGVLINNN